VKGAVTWQAVWEDKEVHLMESTGSRGARNGGRERGEVKRER